MPEQSARDESAVARQAQADLRWLREAIELSRHCPPSETAFSVGAVLVSDAGEVIATGYWRELDPGLTAPVLRRADRGRRDPPRGYRVAGAAVVHRRRWRHQAAKRRGHGGRDSVAGRTGPIGQRAPAAAAKRLITVPVQEGRAVPPCRGPCGSSPRLG